MYTVKILNKSIQRSAKRIVVNVEFSKNGVTHTEEFSFGLGITLEQINRTIKNYVTALELTESTVDNVEVGNLDLSLISDTQTQQEIEKSEWFSDFGKLERANKLVSLGVLTGTEVPFVNLKTKVKNNFKPIYLADM